MTPFPRDDRPDRSSRRRRGDDPLEPSTADGALRLADISGYTSFLRSVSDAHRDAFADGAVPDAYAMMSDLLDGIVRRLDPPYTLSKLEGDAVFAYAVDTPALPHGSDLLGCFTECYADFRRRPTWWVTAPTP